MFDDYMEATAPLQSIQVLAWQLPDSTPLLAGKLMTVRQHQALRDTARAVQPPPAAAAAQDTARLLPINELVWVPTTPLAPQTRYRFQVSGYQNLHNVPRTGGGSVVATSPARVRTPPPLRPDSAAARDSTAVPRDTTRL